MGFQESSDYCPRCVRFVMSRRDTTNHVLHAVLTLLLCLFWLPVWVVCAGLPGDWRCTTCGDVVRRSGSLWPLAMGGAVACALFVAAALAAPLVIGALRQHELEQAVAPVADSGR